jgi:peptidyl-prolyl cis-trans isomerase B (cyclophilin B)
MQSLRFVAAATAAAFCLPAQELPGVRLSLSSRPVASARGDVEVKLAIEATADVVVPGDWLTAVRLDVRCNGAALPPVAVAGKGGEVALAAGTRIERTLRVPGRALLPSPTHGEAAVVALAVTGAPSAACELEVAPDPAHVDLAALDLAKTQVVLATNHGDLRLSFRPDKAKGHVENFVKLCLQGFYDGTKFHRVVRGFMVQGGCPFTKDEAAQEKWGTGGPGYAIPAEFNDLRHLRGTLSMARTSDPNSAGSGFFLCHREAAHLDRKYTAFGNLVAGADVLDRIAETPVGGPTRELPIAPVELIAAIVLPVKK